MFQYQINKKQFLVKNRFNLFIHIFIYVHIYLPSLVKTRNTLSNSLLVISSTTETLQNRSNDPVMQQSLIQCSFLLPHSKANLVTYILIILLILSFSPKAFQKTRQRRGQILRECAEQLTGFFFLLYILYMFAQAGSGKPVNRTSHLCSCEQLCFVF